MQALTQPLLDNILNIADQAGEHLKRFYQQSVAIQIKADKTPVTEADLFISQFVIEQLQKLTPNVPILSEESCKIPLSERSQWQEYWIVDPLDGTQQFIDRTDQFSVVIGLVQHNRPVLGVIHSPMLEKTYYAMHASGAFVREKGEVRPLGIMGTTCKEQAQSDRLLVTIGTTDSNKIREAVRPPYQVDFLQFGSSSLKAGLVAEGKADCYVRLGDTGEWDTAVAEILLAETGGQVFDLHFQPLSYNQRETFVNPYFIMVANKQRDWQQIFAFN
ncbi:MULTISPECIES: 3'(2'),5'-bisphosphate nucleotidase CysQ [Glaesserella]|uniref:3'(2'),5'-bisphosphate nucleotidase CysQ n=1 Tax=Glaesserella australis TaxID=2094024 RepID=A0A328BYQ6_9PAST|nr:MULTISPECIES: 3'(2'),5'-bisphosphate nucleotidase CysQ [Glaesserella]AUI66370.1 3'(2'),5'-bisphosphate nucleotidase [Glaesserella sp. 15-184]RAL19416.1 3'(2'),5'-bisphosphate nucleotidase [Glaesserella australis]